MRKTKFSPEVEDFVQFIWQNQYFNKEDLSSEQGEKLNIIKPGFLNNDSGPDFKNAEIIIDDVTWAGQVEIHINASDWFKHSHQNDPNYDNVILHVVWNYDRDIFRNDGSIIPVLALENRVKRSVLLNFKGMRNLNGIACSNQLSEIPHLEMTFMIQRAFVERMESKTERVKTLLNQTKNDWNVVALRFFLENLSFNKNRDLFIHLGRLIPWKKWHNLNLKQKEALIFGLSGMLSKPVDAYSRELYHEFKFLKYKWNLATGIKAHQWIFSKIRPSSFPSIKLAQFCSLTTQTQHFFDHCLYTKSPKAFLDLFKGSVSEYWQRHYYFQKASGNSKKGISRASSEKLMANFWVPLLMSYADYRSDFDLKIRALQLLDPIGPESNNIINHWKKCHITPVNLTESQGLIQLYKYYCSNKLCLNCRIGKNILTLNSN